jgi:hypothetical protein
MDEAELQFHIQENDYFGTLATVVDLVAQSLKKKGTSREIAALGHVQDQLMYLQQHYRFDRGVHLVSMTGGNESDGGELARL